MNDLELTLEELIDRDGLANVVNALSEVCYAKTDHVLASWSDYDMAERWSKAGRRLATARDRLANIIPD